MNLFTFAVLISASMTVQAASSDVPQRKSGLWQISVSHAQAQGRAMRF
jgi:hypothetical protein